MPNSTNPTPPVLPPNEGKITLSREEYAAIMGKISNLEGQMVKLENHGVIDLDEVREHTARVRLWDGKVVVATSNARMKEGVDPILGTTMEIDLTLRDDKNHDVHKVVDYLDFVRTAPHLEVKILKMKLVDEGIQNFGTVEVKEVKEYKTQGTGFRVPLRVKTPVYQATVLFDDGREMNINQRFLNI